MRIKLFKLYTVHASFCTFSIRMSLFLSAGKPTPLSWLTYEVWIWVNSPASFGLAKNGFAIFSYIPSTLFAAVMLPLWRHKIANILLFMERGSLLWCWLNGLCILWQKMILYLVWIRRRLVTNLVFRDLKTIHGF